MSPTVVDRSGGSTSPSSLRSAPSVSGPKRPDPPPPTLASLAGEEMVSACRGLSNMAPKCNPPGALPMADDGNPRKIGEGPQVGAHYRSIGGSRGCGDQEIVSTTRASLLAG